MTEQIYIDGAWRQPTTGETIPVYCPSDGREFARIGRGNAADVDAAVAAVRRALQGTWGRTPAVERGRLMARLGEKTLRANDNETHAPGKFKLEGIGEPSRGHAQQELPNGSRGWRRHGGRPTVV